jgi:hypothetical protein
MLAGTIFETIFVAFLLMSLGSHFYFYAATVIINRNISNGAMPKFKLNIEN